MKDIGRPQVRHRPVGSAVGSRPALMQDKCRFSMARMLAFVLAMLAVGGSALAVAPKPWPKPNRIALGQVDASSTSLVPAVGAESSAAIQAAPSVAPPPKPVAKPSYVAVLDPRHGSLVYLPASVLSSWQAYTHYRDIKAFAVSVSGLNARPVAAFSVAHKGVAEAIDGALTACEATARELGRPTDCEIFAIGDFVVFGAEPGYDRLVMQTMETLSSTGRSGRGAKGRITKL